MATYYGIAGSFKVMKAKNNHFFDKKMTSITAEKAKQFFYTSNEQKITLVKSLEDAKFCSIEATQIECGNFGNYYKDRAHFYTTPIFILELPDDFKLPTTFTGEININTDVKLQLAKEMGIFTHTKAIRSHLCERKDILNLVAVYVFHPQFKKQYIEIDKPLAVNAESFRKVL